jgi:hypothetical protein
MTISQETFNSLRRDICDIVYCLTAPEEQDDSEAEYERFEEVLANQNHFEQKYGVDLIDQIRALIHDIPHKVALVAKIRESL